MFLNRSYYLPDYKNYPTLPKLFIRVMTVAVKFKGYPAPMYFTVDDSKVLEVRDQVRMGTTLGCHVKLPSGDTLLAWYVSAGWRNGLFQLWIHNPVAGNAPEPIDDKLVIENWTIHEYNLYHEPSDDRRVPSIYDKPIDNYDTRDELVLNKNKYGFEIMERLKAMYDYDTKTTVDLATLSPDDMVTTVILRHGATVLGYRSFKDDVNAVAIATELRRMVPAEAWYDCELEMMSIAEFLVHSREFDAIIPRHWKTRNFSSESSHCAVGRSVFSCENGKPKFKLFKETTD